MRTSWVQLYFLRNSLNIQAFEKANLWIAIPCMVLILDGNSLRGAHITRNISYSTCSRHLISSRAVTNRVFYPKRPNFLHACATCIELPSNISIIGFFLHPEKVDLGFNKTLGENNNRFLNILLNKIIIIYID